MMTTLIEFGARVIERKNKETGEVEKTLVDSQKFYKKVVRDFGEKDNFRIIGVSLDKRIWSNGEITYALIVGDEEEINDKVDSFGGSWGGYELSPDELIDLIEEAYSVSVPYLSPVEIRKKFKDIIEEYKESGLKSVSPYFTFGLRVVPLKNVRVVIPDEAIDFIDKEKQGFNFRAFLETLQGRKERFASDEEIEKYKAYLRKVLAIERTEKAVRDFQEDFDKLGEGIKPLGVSVEEVASKLVEAKQRLVYLKKEVSDIENQLREGTFL